MPLHPIRTDHGGPLSTNPNQPRTGRGKFTRSIDTAQRDADAARLRARGLTYEQIANELGYADRKNAYNAVERALRATVEEPAAEVRKLELERLDHLWQAALKVLETDHLTVSHGKVITRMVGVKRDEDGIEILDPLTGKTIPVYEDVIDDGPKLAAIDRLLKIQARRAALLGLDTPVRADVTVHQVDPMDTALAEVIREAKAKQAAEEAKLRGES